MNQKRYVQHLSGQGERWEVLGEERFSWATISNGPGGCLWLPKSEYVLCDTPEEWREVSVQIVEHSVKHDTRDQGGVYDGAKKLAQLMCGGTHRIKTLIVERKVQP